MAKTVAADEFEAHSLALLEEVAQKREELLIVDDGRPLARVVPIGWPETRTADVPRRRRTLEELRGSVTILGDIVEPLEDEWDVMK